MNRLALGIPENVQKTITLEFAIHNVRIRRRERYLMKNQKYFYFCGRHNRIPLSLFTRALRVLSKLRPGGSDFAEMKTFLSSPVCVLFIFVGNHQPLDRNSFACVVANILIFPLPSSSCPPFFPFVFILLQCHSSERMPIVPSRDCRRAIIPLMCKLSSIYLSLCWDCNLTECAGKARKQRKLLFFLIRISLAVHSDWAKKRWPVLCIVSLCVFPLISFPLFLFLCLTPNECRRAEIDDDIVFRCHHTIHPMLDALFVSKGS